MSQARVLVIDVDQEVRQLIRLTLSEMDYEVVEAASAEEGVAAMRANNGRPGIDVILCNCRIPSKNGPEPLMQFLMHPPAVPVVALADHPDLQHAAQMFRLGVVDYLVKPVQVRALVEAVRHAITIGGKSR